MVKNRLKDTNKPALLEVGGYSADSRLKNAKLPVNAINRATNTILRDCGESNFVVNALKKRID